MGCGNTHVDKFSKGLMH